MKKLTKNGLALEVSKLLDLTHKDGMKITDAVFKCLLDCMVKGQSVEIRNFGTWHHRVFSGRTVRNPKTGETLKIQARKRVAFRAGKMLREGVRGD
jgi:DNA-binding protein HU-beta